ncbi:hypothetical protein [uncultured Campylobacter sp.]|uniref:hypothetical protein n=1 Tax=uncultured Campylobacter sp. TaxID=218934 RepID=UPI0026364726|nr:hypothetical protein [uncultured Campylobacter sp.]
MTFAQADAIGMVLNDRDFTPLVAKFENLDKITLDFGEQKDQMIGKRRISKFCFVTPPNR